MRSCVLYARVSSDRQSGNTSIADQLALLRAWAARSGYDVAAEFVDDGESARVREALTESFDSRPGWRALRLHLKENPAKRGGPSAVVFKDYKRFSRDVAAAHATIRELRNAGVEVQAAEQPIDWSVPEQKLLVGIYLADGEVDNDRRSAAVRRGMAARVRSGLYTFRPPVGYRATYDGRRRLGIEPDPDKAPAVMAAFERAANPDVPLTVVAAEFNARLGGRVIASMDAFKRFLENRTFVGDVPVPVASRDELGEWVTGAHTPIVPAALWQAVQERLEGRARVYARRKPVHPELYLRGLVRSGTSADVLTGSGTRSRHGYRVWYYHGRGKGAERVKAAAVHDGIGAWLAARRPSDGMMELARACILEELTHADRHAGEERRDAEHAATKATKRLERATEALIDGHITPDAYAPLAARYRAERDVALARLDAAPVVETAGLDGMLDRVLALVASLSDLYAGATPEERRELVGSTMPGGVCVHADGIVEPLPSPLLGLLFGLNGAETAGTQNGRPGEDGRFATWYAREDSNL